MVQSTDFASFSAIDQLRLNAYDIFVKSTIL